VQAIHLAVAQVDALVAAMPAPAAWLSAAELTRLAQIRVPARRAQFLAGRWLVRELLNLHRPGVAWSMNAPPQGPPQVLAPHGPAMHASISHSGAQVACAIAPMPLGIDLEVPRRARDIEGLVRTVCTAREQARLATGDVSAGFYACWTLKEAWLKARGEDMSPGRLAQVDTMPPHESKERPCALLWRQGGMTLALVAPVDASLRWARPAPAEVGALWCIEDLARER
jgi:4'-phosphopantetheinyl transferase